MKERFIRVPERDHHFTSWFILSFAIATTFSAIIVAVSNPVGTTLLSHLLNIGKIIALNGLIFPAWVMIISTLFSFMYIPVPRLFLAGFSYLIASTITIFIIAKSGILFSILIGMIYGLVALILGFLFIMLSHKNVRRKVKITILATILISVSIYLLF